jgi:hypothetical protein
VTSGDHPDNPDDPGQWYDMKWVPNVFQKYPNSIDPNWPKSTFVNGYVVLATGSVKAAKPTDLDVVHAMWDFKKSTPDNTSFSQAITDAVSYSTTLTGPSVVITLTRPDNNVTTIEIAPNNHHVQLSLSAKHSYAPHTDTIPVGTPIPHFCGFYQLMVPPPRDNDQLLPYFVSPQARATPTDVTKNEAFPGPLCPPDYAEVMP